MTGQFWQWQSSGALGAFNAEHVELAVNVAKDDV
jgi:hypothetical protein